MAEIRHQESGIKTGEGSLEAALASTAAPAETSSPAADDLSVLLPEHEIVIGGESVTVRELNFGEQLKYGPVLAAFTHAIKPAFDVPVEEGWTLILDALAVHHEQLIALVALCCGRDRAFIDALTGEDGETLLLTWWMVNKDFFIRRLTRPLLVKAMAARSNAQAGAKSSPL
ncbi:hypothetical protein AGMMS50256_27560 [Betaproteobacteria bacterium]|nr:hypothetical protein AGMMS50256_27560 [Betaproteobacteria bacterium]